MRVWLPVLPRPGDLKADLVDLLRFPPIQHVENRTLSVLGACRIRITLRYTDRFPVFLNNRGCGPCLPYSRPVTVIQTRDRTVCLDWESVSEDGERPADLRERAC